MEGAVRNEEEFERYCYGQGGIWKVLLQTGRIMEGNFTDKEEYGRYWYRQG